MNLLLERAVEREGDDRVVGGGTIRGTGRGLGKEAAPRQKLSRCDVVAISDKVAPTCSGDRFRGQSQLFVAGSSGGDAVWWNRI